MATSSNNALSAAIIRLLRPLVRLMLRNGITHGTFSELAKWVFVDVAAKEFNVEGRKQSDTRISIITGLTRKEVARLTKIDVPDDTIMAKQYNRAARVISGWMNDPRFIDKKGNPVTLVFDGDESSFCTLVRSYSGDMTPRSILDELIQAGAVEEGDDGDIHLVTTAYIPTKCDSSKLHILGNDVSHLIATIDHNLSERSGDLYFQRKVEYNNLPVEALPKLKKLTEVNGQALLIQLNDYLSTQDRDATPSAQGSGRKRAGVGIYYFEEDVPEEK